MSLDEDWTLATTWCKLMGDRDVIAHWYGVTEFTVSLSPYVMFELDVYWKYHLLNGKLNILCLEIAIALQARL